MDVLIDNKANICPIGSGVVRHFDNQPLSNALLPDDLVHNYGYVRFRIGVRDASCSTRAALHGLQYANYASLID